MYDVNVLTMEDVDVIKHQACVCVRVGGGGGGIALGKNPDNIM